jgi:hypothetical protein
MEGGGYPHVAADDGRKLHAQLVQRAHHTGAGAKADSNWHDNAHSVFMDGPLATHMLHAHSFRGKMDKDLQGHLENVVSTQKWIYLMDVILDDFKGKGLCVTMDSTYMKDVMAQIRQEEWQLNMVGTSQSSRVGAGINDIVNKMKVGTYESIIWEHKTKNLVFAAWSGNAIV